MHLIILRQQASVVPQFLRALRPLHNVRRSDCGSPSPQSREFLSFLLYLKVTIRVNVLIRVLNYSNFYHITDVTELCDSGKNPPISKRLGIYDFFPFIFSKV